MSLGPRHTWLRIVAGAPRLAPPLAPPLSPKLRMANGSTITFAARQAGKSELLLALLRARAALEAAPVPKTGRRVWPFSFEE